MDTNELRLAFIKFFEKKKHQIVKSSPVVPHDDPTLLFCNAGMNQFKDVFLGKEKRDYVRAVTSQKCIRVGGKHNDLDNVGHTSRHMTFFEMLGNFSFGDYFKVEAIAFAWELITEVWQLPKEKLWVSVFEEDDEAHEIWKRHIDESRIVRMDAKENFWSMGDVGPCGPCSEILFDRGPEYGDFKSPLDPGADERYPEFWNLVFMQYNRSADGKMSPLPNPCVDTGAGIERIMAFQDGMESVFETDVLAAIIAKCSDMCGVKYAGAHKPAFHVVADHLRALSFAIADGAEPGNVDRGYVLRKILRRAVRYGKLLGFEKPFLAELVPVLIEKMGGHYIELKQAEKRICELLTVEEEGFFRTLKRGGNIMSKIIADSEKGGEIRGADAFKLKDTYGFPLEEIVLIAKDHSLSVNLEEYQLLEERAKELSRKAHTSKAVEVEESLFPEFVEKHGTCNFVGYEQPHCEGSIIGLLKDGQLVEKLTEGEEGAVILNSTPFYAEKGGQVGDIGELSHSSAKFQVHGTTSPYAGVVLHHGQIASGTLIEGEPLDATIAEHRRVGIMHHHTATHLLNWALTKHLGEHIRQAGSLVEEDRLRFDFNHHKSLEPQDIRAIEQMVNEKIRGDVTVTTKEIPYTEAQEDSGIKQFFGDKYGAMVRVVDIGGYAKELCGGTHVHHTGVIGLFRITKETSIAKGVRRIEASCGVGAENYMYGEEDALKAVADKLGTPVGKLHDRVEKLLAEQKAMKDELSKVRQAQVRGMLKGLMEQVEEISGTKVLTAKVEVGPGDLRNLANDLHDQMGSGILLLGVEHEGRCQLLIKVSNDLSHKAGDLIREVAPLVGGSGGGKKDSAQAGGKDPAGMQEAFTKLKTLI